MSRPLLLAALLLGTLVAPLSAAFAITGPDLGAALGPAAIAFALTLVGAFGGYKLGRLTQRDAYREWALSRDGALWTIAILSVIAGIITMVAGLALGAALLCGYLAARDPPRASDVAFLVSAGEVVASIAFHAKAWQDGALFALPVILLSLGLAAREAWDLAHLLADVDPASLAAGRRAYAGLVSLLAATGLFAIGIGWWLHAGGQVSWAPRAGSRGWLLGLVVAGAAGAAWLLARRKRAGA